MAIDYMANAIFIRFKKYDIAWPLKKLNFIVMEQNSKNQQKPDQQKKSHSNEEDLMSTGGSENASASRGGTTDMDQESLTIDRTPASERGSGLSTKRNVTGSDFDGQNR